MHHRLAVVVQTPAHSGLSGPLTYQSPEALPPGTLVRVPLGKRETLGVVWPVAEQDLDTEGVTERPVAGVLAGLPPLGPAWMRLVSFASRYYQRSLGEVALASLPPQLRELGPEQLARRLKRPQAAAPDPATPTPAGLALTAEQAEVCAQLEQHPGPFLLFGATGSGKTEVYLHAVQALLERDPSAQALIMVPEINLTPQLEERFQARFAPRWGVQAVVSMHSGMTPAQRLKSWLAAHSGQARMVLGTRMSIFASMPGLQLIIVDEEHDPSYKQQEGARYSARDLAVYRGQQEGAKVLLGSATPSLESWHHSRPSAEGGRYQRLLMPTRVGAAADAGLPRVRRVDMNRQSKGTVFSPQLVSAMQERVARGEQVMVFLNRRGYAPVLHCNDCGWKSECPHCSAFRVFHRIDRTLRCHHCGFTQAVPRACPDCGNLDIAPLGRGTERLEEQLAELMSETLRPDGQPARIARIDADSTRAKGALESQLAQVHGGEVDVLVGTQMIAKGHDFRRVTLVAAINPDGALFSSDFRAPERLFALLMQAAGRAGRDAAFVSAQKSEGEMWVQTFYPTHPLFEALKTHDYPAFAQAQLEEREQAGMPPFSFQALVRAEARTQAVAQGFLNSASAAGAELEGASQVFRFSAVPMTIQRVANIERAQMLIESPSRAALQRFLAQWQAVLHATRAAPEHKGLIRWAVDVDPLLI
ncbi:primosomal protein N' [Curvibacter sp. HBC28]|uniref:Replication restart protein PriA n=1 Tax=Curvibacter microcysteis TaxID=3026419 RepID=A0ABT5MAY2_9BURK|nr:primosomal protein N' [Curvibacter sp. HBC28]MDD0813591.1 primosomal protein N' [Curvibacter sp. HBC28]